MIYLIKNPAAWRFTLAALVGPTHAASPPADQAPLQSAPFRSFQPQVKLRWNQSFLYVENNGLPTHPMMVGITAWQQQVPMPQSYFGENAWRIPLKPIAAQKPQTLKGHFLRGAIALAANGIPIFNPLNNRGEISQEIGELDQWGGHCGRADDYHYHAAPLHLQSSLAKGMPIAYALDGYPIHGLTEPNGDPIGKLDECGGHTTDALGYHYHASTTYPYVIGGFHGEVVEREGQVDPQPRAHSVREAQAPLRGAKITDFKSSADGKSFSLRYVVNSKPASVDYRSNDQGSWDFVFTGTDGTKREETYQAGERRSPGSPRGRDGEQKGRGSRSPSGRPSQKPDEKPAPAAPTVRTLEDGNRFVLKSPKVADGGVLPTAYTGDGAGSTLPLEWNGAPVGTVCYALVMHHLDPEGVTKWYWTLYDIPKTITSLPENVSGIGKLGTGFKGRIGYEAPHSQGPGAKTYTLTLYALSAPAEINVPPSKVNYEVLLAGIQGRILAHCDLNVIYRRN